MTGTRPVHTRELVLLLDADSTLPVDRAACLHGLARLFESEPLLASAQYQTRADLSASPGMFERAVAGFTDDLFAVAFRLVTSNGEICPLIGVAQGVPACLARRPPKRRLPAVSRAADDGLARQAREVLQVRVRRLVSSVAPAARVAPRLRVHWNDQGLRACADRSVDFQARRAGAT